MDLKTAFLVFSVVFIAELGDKTQLATLLFSADRAASKWTIFASETALRYVAGAGFVAIGIWTLISASMQVQA